MQQRDRSPVHKLWFVCILSIARSTSGLKCMNPCYFCHRSLLSLCVHASTVSLSLYLSTSITFPLASQGNWVLHVIAPWENQIGTSRFLWVGVLCLPQTPIQSFFFFFRMFCGWHVTQKGISDLCGVCPERKLVTAEHINVTLTDTNVAAALRFKVNWNKCWIHYRQSRLS